jgi:YidC/Oxa1 family membrane protein insertase
VNPLNPLYIAVAWVMTHIHSGLSLIMPSTSGEAWFLTIVVLVVVMRLILVPLFVKQMHAMRKMSALTPQLQELRKKYKGDKQTLNEETMRLYKEAGVNPLGGCLPLLAQMPLFFALFSVLRAIAGWHEGLPSPYNMPISVVKSAQNANILGAHISDKVLFTGTMHVPLHAKIVILCAVAISVTTTFMTVRQSTKRGMTPQMTPDNPMASSQKYMSYIVPFFALSGLYWAFGLVLYWVTTNVWTLGQQWVLFKRYPATPATATAGTTSSPGVSPKPATSAGLVSGNSNKVVRRPAAPRSAADAAKRPTPAKPAPAKSTAAKPAAAKPAPAGAAPASRAKPGTDAKSAAGTKPATGTKPAAGTKPAGGAKPAAARSASAKSSASSGRPQSKKPAGNAAAAGGSAQRKPQQSRPAGQEASGNGSASVSGILRRFGRGREETEEQPESPEVKLVRQQRVRQSRSKRSGKR